MEAKIENNEDVSYPRSGQGYIIIVKAVCVQLACIMEAKIENNEDVSYPRSGQGYIQY